MEHQATYIRDAVVVWAKERQTNRQTDRKTEIRERERERVRELERERVRESERGSLGATQYLRRGKQTCSLRRIHVCWCSN